MASKTTSTSQRKRSPDSGLLSHTKEISNSEIAPKDIPLVQTLKILFVASECAPFAKTGGLGDVVGALPKSLKRMGHDVRILMPLYSCIDRAKYGIRFDSSACIHMGNREEQWVGIYTALLDQEVTVWFVECERFFGRPGIYHESWGEYGDNAFRFALLSKAALQICKDKNFVPEVMHCHDWQSALVAGYLKTWDRILSPLSNTASVLTIHNIGYQGVYHPSAFPYIGLGWEHFTADKMEDHGKMNLLKAGVFFADALTTVSPSHATELLDPIGGCGLAPYLNSRKADLFGILNGVDYDYWNPETDKLIPAKYSSSNLTGKHKCKLEVQKRFSLETKAEIPLFGIVSRFAQQKGFDLLREALPRALQNMAFQLVVLGNGDQHTEDFFKWLSSVFPGRVGAHIGFSNELSHWIEAGSDFFLMPSLYEPCGLNQMYSLKYGTLPIVRSTGGLNDTVENYNEQTGAGTGFKFLLPTAPALHDTIGWAISTWYDRPHHIEQLRKQAMSREFRWEDSAQKYLQVYQYAFERRNSLK
jgi:starch synthase